jgi:Heterokaryon incompatibility protein (HET)
MGEQYLWSGTICIVQYGDDSKMEAMRSTDIIYQHARFTMIDASGQSADDGLCGIDHVPRPLLRLRQTIKDVSLIWTGSQLSDILHYSA